MSKYKIFCSIECNREYHSMSVGYAGDGHETHCENCGAPLEEDEYPEGHSPYCHKSCDHPCHDKYDEEQKAREKANGV